MVQRCSRRAQHGRAQRCKPQAERSLMLRNLICPISSRTLSGQPFRRLVASRAMPGSTENIAMVYTGWSNKPLYMQLLQERGVPVHDADSMQEADWDRVTFATVWNPPPGLLDKCPNLRCVMSLGAGVDTLMTPGLIPQHLPIARIVDPLMASRMATWVVWGVINWQRKMDDYADAQRRCEWDQAIESRSNRDSCDVAVGLMGMGVMGLATAKALQSLGYRVSGWSRTKPSSTQQQQEREGLRTFAGQQQLQEFVAQQDVLVCLLPLTQQTTGIINAELLSWLRPGSALINGGRGKHVVEEDLLAALNSDKVGFALLDVFATEPLPPTSPLWSHPRVRITPHVASMTTLETAADQIAANYHSVVSGQGVLPVNLVDRDRGY